MDDSKGDYYADDFLESEPAIKTDDEMFEQLVDNFERETEINERQEVRSNLY